MDKKIKVILKEALEEIRPDGDYEKKIFEMLNSVIKNINHNQKSIRAVLGGSGAKGTWLKTFDADIFVLFNYNKFVGKSERLSDILEPILKRKFKKVMRLHGSRDYFQIRQDGFTLEIVPILKIQKAEHAKNITDVSPLHSGWVQKHRKLINDMKLAKQFCRANDVYGAESYIRGFSGYVCEILTVYYGSFYGLIRNAAKWQDKAVIDVMKYYKGKDIFKVVNTSKLISPLIVIDPVQKDRNAAAALSRERFEAFKKASKEFIKKPSKKFFAKKDLKSEFSKLKGGSRKIVEILVRPLAEKTDVAGSKLLKIYEFLAQHLQKSGFKAVKFGWEWDKGSNATFYFMFGKKPLPKTVETEGPPISIKIHAENFRKLHKKTFVKNNKVYAIDKRKYIHPQDLLTDIIKDEFVKERSKSVTARVMN